MPLELSSVLIKAGEEERERERELVAAVRTGSLAVRDLFEFDSGLL
jgi:hypothetical protein